MIKDVQRMRFIALRTLKGYRSSSKILGTQSCFLQKDFQPHQAKAFSQSLIRPLRPESITASSVRTAQLGLTRHFSQASRRRAKNEVPDNNASSNPDRPTPPTKKPLTQRTLDVQQAIKTRITQNLAHENIYTLPNILTFSRLIATPVIGYLILHDHHFWAVSLFAYAGITDLIDGWIARKWNLQSVVGSVIDPMADKALMTVLTITLAIKGLLPIWVATLILGRDVSLAIAAIYYRYASLPLPKTLARYWDFSLPSAEVHPTQISKINTMLQLMLIGAATAFPVLPFTTLSGVSTQDIMHAFQWTVAGTTLWSGLSYLYTRDAVKILGDHSREVKLGILKNGRRVIAASFAACFVLALCLEHM